MMTRIRLRYVQEVTIRAAVTAEDPLLPIGRALFA